MCTPNPALYSECVNDSGLPASIELFGGTSQSAPFTAAEAALIIQAYRSSHHGSTPSPALVRQIVMSTATDLGAPAQEQGAGLIDTLAAVQAASSYGNVKQREGLGLLCSPSALSATAAPGKGDVIFFRS